MAATLGYIPALRRSSAVQGIRKGDLVQVIAGADRGKQGRVIGVDLSRGKLRVEGVRMQKRHLNQIHHHLS